MKRLFLLVLVLALIPAAGAANEISVLTVSVENESDGGVAQIFLDVRQGRGATYIDSFPFTKLDTQISMRFAREYACALAEKDCSSLDFFYVIRAPSSVIAGPSAGAAATVLSYAAIEDLELREDVTMTGTVGSGGIIGPVGGVSEKVRAARDEGFSRVLVPAAQYNESLSVEGIEVLPVADVEEAIYYYTGVDVRPEPVPIAVPPEYYAQMEEIADSLCTRAEQLAAAVGNVSNTTAERREQGVSQSAQGNYYSAASYCFSANLELRERLVSEKEQSERGRMYRQLEVDIEALDQSLPENISSLADLEVFMVVRERLLDSYDSLQDLNHSNISASGLAYALERYNSAVAWSAFFGAVPSREIDVSEEELSQMCERKLAEAEERINYISYVLPTGMGQSREGVENAREDQRQEEYALCVFKASKARAEADSVLSALYGRENLNASVDRKLDKAGVLLGQQTRQGNFPIVAYSYYEYAQQLEDVYSANLYAEYALELSSLGIYVPDREPVRVYDPVRVWLLIAGVFVGLAAGVLGAELWHRKKD